MAYLHTSMTSNIFVHKCLNNRLSAGQHRRLRPPLPVRRSPPEHSIHVRAKRLRPRWQELRLSSILPILSTLSTLLTSMAARFLPGNAVRLDRDGSHSAPCGNAQPQARKVLSAPKAFVQGFKNKRLGTNPVHYSSADFHFPPSRLSPTASTSPNLSSPVTSLAAHGFAFTGSFAPNPSSTSKFRSFEATTGKSSKDSGDRLCSQRRTGFTTRQCSTSRTKVGVAGFKMLAKRLFVEISTRLFWRARSVTSHPAGLTRQPRPADFGATIPAPLRLRCRYRTRPTGSPLSGQPPNRW